MKSLLITLILFFAVLTPAHAAYEISNFTSHIEIQKNTRIKVIEVVQVNFLDHMHGIYRTIPVVYSSGLTRINGKIKVLSVTDEAGVPYKFTTSQSGRNLKIKIGDANKTIIGPHVYTITYEAKNIVRRFEDHDELYWNVTGSEWDTPIASSEALVESNFAPLGQLDCFTGEVGSIDTKCAIATANSSKVTFSNSVSSGQGSDFTIVVGLTRPNMLQFPGLWERLVDAGLVTLVLAAFPGLGMAYLWFTRGRDLRFLGDNVYSPDASSQVRSVGLFEREHLPMVYSPINNLTPAEAGTIIDHKVDLADVVAEIMELARLRYLEIYRIESKKLFGLGKEDYLFVETNQGKSKLKPHQAQLLAALTKPAYLATPTTIEKVFSASQAEKLASKAFVMSKMKNKFYTDLEAFKRTLYTNLTADKIFVSAPDKTKGGWIAGSIILQYLVAQILAPVNPWVIPVAIGSGIVAVIFAYLMPRRTAQGHALYRQLVGLQYFVGKGKWRYEIAEKRLFLEEILPLAISLGVVNQLTQDMQALALKPPQYMGNVTPAYFGSFQSQMGTSMSSRPGSSSSGGWSGGSGFSGGSSGGGGGGGGGGGW